MDRFKRSDLYRNPTPVNKRMFLIYIESYVSGIVPSTCQELNSNNRYRPEKFIRSPKTIPKPAHTEVSRNKGKKEKGISIHKSDRLDDSDETDSSVESSADSESSSNSETSDRSESEISSPIRTPSNDQDFTFGAVQEKKDLYDVLKRGKSKKTLLKKALIRQRKNEKLKQTEEGKVCSLYNILAFLDSPGITGNSPEQRVGTNDCDGSWRKITR